MDKPIRIQREPNGRRSRRGNKTETDATKVVMDTRMRLYGASASECARHEYGSVLGRLLMAGRITLTHFEAGNRAADDYDKYYRLTGIPFPSARAQDVSRVRGLGGDVDPEAARGATDRVKVLEALLREVDEPGRPVTSVFKRVCIVEDQEGAHLPQMVRYLVKALDRLAVHYGLDKQKAA